jgi:putative tricarboxylic transport membrane protein
MKKNDCITSVIWFCAGLFITVYAPRFKLGTASEPGSGLMPFVSGIVICVSSTITFLISIANTSGSIKKVWENIHIRKLLFIFIVLLLYAFMMEKIGFILCTFAMVLLLVRFVDPQSWLKSLITAGVSSTAAYILFETWLQAQLPKGIFGF